MRKGNKGFPNHNKPSTKLSLKSISFVAILDEITQSIQENVPWCMLFVGNIILVAKTEEGVNAKLKRWRQELKSHVLN